MRTQSDLPPITSPEDLALRMPTLSGYKVTNCGIVCLASTSVEYSRVLGPESMIHGLPAEVARIRADFDPERTKTIAVMWFTPRQGEGSIVSQLLTIGTQYAAKAIDGLDLSMVVDWEANTWATDACAVGDSGHSFSRDIFRPPGQRIYETQLEWFEQFRPQLLELDVEQDRKAQELKDRLQANPKWGDRFLVEAATDPRGMEPAEMAVIEECTVSANYMEAAGVWLSNGWNVDNLVDLSAHTRNPYLRTAIMLTMAVDGFLQYSGAVAKLTTPDRTSGVDVVREVLSGDSIDLVATLIHQMHHLKHDHLLDPNPEGEVD